MFAGILSTVKGLTALVLMFRGAAGDRATGAEPLLWKNSVEVWVLGLGLWSRGLGLWGPRAVAGFVAVPVAGEATLTGEGGAWGWVWGLRMKGLRVGTRGLRARVGTRLRGQLLWGLGGATGSGRRWGLGLGVWDWVLGLGQVLGH